MTHGRTGALNARQTSNVQRRTMRLHVIALICVVTAVAATSAADPRPPIPAPAPSASAGTPKRSVRKSLTVDAKLVTWSYLMVHQPQMAANVVRQVAEGKLPPSVIAGIGNAATRAALLKNAWPQKPTPQRGATHGLPAKGQTKAQTTAANPSTWATLTHGLNGTPEVSPARLKFADAWDKQVKRATVWFTATTDSHVTASLPTGAPFRVAKIVSYEGTVDAGKFKFVPKAWDWRDSAPFSLTVHAGQTFSVTVEFAPVFELGTMMAGQKSGTLEVKDDKWTVHVPLSGMFQGVNINGVVLTPTEDEIGYATPFYPTKDAPVATQLQVFNIGSDTKTVTITADALPAGVTLDGTPSVVVKGGETKNVDVRFLLNGGPGNGWDFGYGQPISLRASAPGGLTSTTTLSLDIMWTTHLWQAYDKTLSVDWRAEWTLFSNGHWEYVVNAANSSLFRATVLIEFYIYGHRVADFTRWLGNVSGIGGSPSDFLDYGGDLAFPYPWSLAGYATMSQQKGTFSIEVNEI